MTARLTMAAAVAVLLTAAPAWAAEGAAPAAAAPATAVQAAPAAPAAAPEPPAPPPVFKEPVTGMELLWVKGGCYQMGDIYQDGTSGTGEAVDERPVHEVCVDGFYIGKTEVTQAQWRAVMGPHEVTDATCTAPECPVDGLSWEQIQEFVKRLNAKGGEGKLRLPTEAEWEYAARSGGQGDRYAGGNDVEAVAWFEANSDARTIPFVPVSHPVGGRLPNALGIHDMSGNVYEVTADWYAADWYARSPRDNPKGPPTGELRVARGGCGSGHPGNVRTARRNPWDGMPTGVTGIRLVRSR